MQGLQSHELLCTERWVQLRDQMREHREEFRSFRNWAVAGFITMLCTVVGAFGWLVVERALSPH